MSNIEKKSLEHVFNLLDNYESYKVYSQLNQSLIHFKVEPEIAKGVLKWHEEAAAKENTKIKEAKDWIRTLISDIK